MNFQAVIKLNQEDFVAEGTYRRVYLHPDNANLVLKVLKPKAAYVPGRHIRNFLKSRSIRQLYRFMYREFETYLTLKLRQSKIGGPLPISEIYGLQETTDGLAMVVEKAVNTDGSLGWSLSQLKESDQITDDIIDALNRFFAELTRWDLLGSDMNPNNLVLHHREDGAQFILVDGFGDAAAIPVRTWSRTLRNRSNNRKFQRMATFLNRPWNAEKNCIE